uniref:Uncharacterized protein n=1 Tax=Arundo donax TaxID=35708 RepID=A0A0A9ARN8_ARUDO
MTSTASLGYVVCTQFIKPLLDPIKCRFNIEDDLKGVDRG